MALIVGHSQVEYLNRYVSDPRVFVQSFPGYSVRQLTNEESFLDVVPDVSSIAVVIGANDIPPNSPATVLDHVEKLCCKIHELNDGASAHVSSILPRADNRFPGTKVTERFLSVFNTTADRINDRLNLLPKRMSWVRFVDHTDFWCDDGNIRREHLSKDGLHLSRLGTETLAHRLQEAVVESIVIPKCILTYPPISTSRDVFGPLTYSQVVSTCQPAETPSYPLPPVVPYQRLQRAERTNQQTNSTTCSIAVQTRQTHLHSSVVVG